MNLFIFCTDLYVKKLVWAFYRMISLIGISIIAKMSGLLITMNETIFCPIYYLIYDFSVEKIVHMQWSFSKIIYLKLPSRIDRMYCFVFNIFYQLY